MIYVPIMGSLPGDGGEVLHVGEVMQLKGWIQSRAPFVTLHSPPLESHCFAYITGTSPTSPGELPMAPVAQLVR